MDVALTGAMAALLPVGAGPGWWRPLATALARPIVGRRFAEKWGVFIGVAYPVIGVFFAIVAVLLAVQ